MNSSLRPNNDFETEERQRCTAFVAVALASVAALASLVWYPKLDDGMQPVGDLTVATGVDVNSAAWHQIAQLPGFGETMARRIVAFRNERRDKTSGGVVFRSANDLMRVPGVGPGTIQRVAQFLRFSAAGGNH